MVDALGGVQIDVCQPIIDTVLGIVIPTAGEQLIHGDTALSLVRAREVQGDPTGDLGRIRRRQALLSALLRQVTSAGTLLNPATLNAFLQAFAQNTTPTTSPPTTWSHSPNRSALRTRRGSPSTHCPPTSARSTRTDWRWTPTPRRRCSRR